MRILVYPHMLEIGGSQLNAIELAAGVRDLGHDMLVFGQPGPLVERVAELELEFVAAPRPRGRPSPKVIRALVGLVRRRGVDIVHGYEWTTALEAYWGPRAQHGVPSVATVMSMAVAPFLPRDMPLAVGTEQIADHERRAGRSAIDVIEPPVDVHGNAPGAVASEDFRRRFELDPEALTIVCVTRLAAQLKLEGVLAAIDAVADLPDSPRAQLVIVGDGPGRQTAAERAERANARAGRRAVILTGELRDPRPGYAAADVCLGMGGSALRAMSFAKPLVVAGEHGFWELLTPETVERFLWTGWYGVGDGAQHGPAKLSAILRDLLPDGARRERLGGYGRGLVQQRFSLQGAAARQLEIYERTLTIPIRRRQWLRPAGASASGLLTHRVRERLEGLRGRGNAEDFNARPVAGVAPRRAG